MIPVLVLLTLLWAAPSWAAFGETWTDSGSTTVYTASTTSNITISAVSGDTICMINSVEVANRTMTVTDNKGGGSNTYTRLATNELAGDSEVWVDCTVSTGTVTQITGTISSTIGAESYSTAVVITGARSTLGTANATTTDSATTNHSPGSLSTTDATGLFILISRHSSTGTITLDGAYTSRLSVTGQVIGSAVITTSSNPTNTTAGTRSCINILAEIRPAAAAGAETFGFRLRVVQ